ncbi:MAG: hypothetical protein J6B06_03495 [Lachnospiraceae bacterium]|nr:hypothetical protein [Lachnospiraceae bacterium]
MKRKLYVDGNTVYGIDEECMKRKQKREEKERESYLVVLMSASYRESLKK